MSAKRNFRPGRFFLIVAIGYVVDGTAALLGAAWRAYTRFWDRVLVNAPGLPLRLKGGKYIFDPRAGIASIVQAWGGVMLDYGGAAYNVNHPAFLGDVQAALVAAPSGTTVIVPEGEYDLVAGLSWAGKRLVGMGGGAVLNFIGLGATVDALELVFTGALDGPRTEVRNLTINMNKAGRDAIRVSGGDDVQLKNLYIKDYGRDGLHMEPGAADQWVENLLIESVHLRLNSSPAATARDAIRFEIPSTAGAGFINECHFRSVDVRGWVGRGLHFLVNNATPGAKVSNITFQGLTIDAAGIGSGTVQPIYFEKGASATGYRVESITFINGGAEDATGAPTTTNQVKVSDAGHVQGLKFINFINGTYSGTGGIISTADAAKVLNFINLAVDLSAMYGPLSLGDTLAVAGATTFASTVGITGVLTVGGFGGLAALDANTFLKVGVGASGGISRAEFNSFDDTTKRGFVENNNGVVSVGGRGSAVRAKLESVGGHIEVFPSGHVGVNTAGVDPSETFKVTGTMSVTSTLAVTGLVTVGGTLGVTGVTTVGGFGGLAALDSSTFLKVGVGSAGGGSTSRAEFNSFDDTNKRGMVENNNGLLTVGGAGSGVSVRLLAGSITGIKVDTTGIGFYGTAPIAKQTGVAVSTAAIHAAIVNLGLFAA